MVIKRGKNWNLPENLVPGESVYKSRREILKMLGYGSLAVCTFGLASCGPASSTGGNDRRHSPDGNPDSTPTDLQKKEGDDSLYPAPTNPLFDDVPGRIVTPEDTADNWLNFQEFLPDVLEYSQELITKPWAVRIKGQVKRPVTLDFEDLVRLFDLEERLYRNRCVEPYSMVVPYTGFPFKKLIDYVEPNGLARYVNITAFFKPEQSIGQRERDVPWPVNDSITLQEAANPLTLIGTGVYGRESPNPFGAPLRLLLPWKYGYKSLKSIVEIEFAKEPISTFWPVVYSEWITPSANVDPTETSPVGSQAEELDLGTMELIPTLPYNGYGDWVAHLYE